ncbi:MAG: hypothetical protein QM619_07470 [Micropruina sp.]|uniref:hypothetical protein n=1 Tax=Micropruina sp. TaxID=2737536 RepID=UPI0039E55574
MHVAVDHCGVGGLGAVVPAGQMLDPGLDALGVDQVEHPIGLVALEEHDPDPPLDHLCSWCPDDAAGVGHRVVEPVMGLVDQRGGLVQPLVAPVIKIVIRHD